MQLQLISRASVRLADLLRGERTGVNPRFANWHAADSINDFGVAADIDGVRAQRQLIR